MIEQLIGWDRSFTVLLINEFKDIVNKYFMEWLFFVIMSQDFFVTFNFTVNQSAYDRIQVSVNAKYTRNKESFDSWVDEE